MRLSRSLAGFGIAFALVLSLASVAHADVPAAFEQANQRYEQGQFAEARQSYESLASAGNRSANLFYNLANACHRLGDTGAAILNYERALALEPGHPEARANLAFLRGKTGAKLRPAQALDYVASVTNPTAASIAAAAGAWIALFCLAAILFKKRTPAVWLGAAAGLAVCAYAGLALWQFERRSALAVVTASKAEARFGPFESAGVADSLPVGSQVLVLLDRGPWVYCELPDRTRAWMPTGTVQRVRPS